MQSSGGSYTLAGTWSSSVVWHVASVAYEVEAEAEAERVYKRFFGPALLTNTAADLYTVPTDKRSRVLTIHASNPTASPVDLTISIGTDARRLACMTTSR